MKNIKKETMEYDWLIVGSGIFGSTFAHLAKASGQRCLVIDKRCHLGGNLYCENKDGIIVHRYGAHIFHTSNKMIWDFVNRHVEFVPYKHSPIAFYKGNYYSLPFNLLTFCKLWGDMSPIQAKQKLDYQRLKNINAKNLEEQAISLVGKDIYSKLIKGYTEKQWGRDCKELPSFIIKRIPLRFTFDNNYFDDIYQGIPKGGYNLLIESLLDGIETKLNVDFIKEKNVFSKISKRILYTGSIDEYFDYRLGALQYRSIRFEDKEYETENYQGCSVINYTDRAIQYTRSIEHRHFDRYCKSKNKTIVSNEYSQEWEVGIEPYYPINNERNDNLYHKYEILANNEKNTIFGGRLGSYKYYDMDDAIEAAILLFNQIYK